jgi:hypothetical protein
MTPPALDPPLPGAAASYLLPPVPTDSHCVTFSVTFWFHQIVPSET